MTHSGDEGAAKDVHWASRGCSEDEGWRCFATSLSHVLGEIVLLAGSCAAVGIGTGVLFTVFPSLENSVLGMGRVFDRLVGKDVIGPDLLGEHIALGFKAGIVLFVPGILFVVFCRFVLSSVRRRAHANVDLTSDPSERVRVFGAAARLDSCKKSLVGPATLEPLVFRTRRSVPPSLLRATSSFQVGGYGYWMVLIAAAERSNPLTMAVALGPSVAMWFVAPAIVRRLRSLRVEVAGNLVTVREARSLFGGHELVHRYDLRQCRVAIDLDRSLVLIDDTTGSTYPVFIMRLARGRRGLALAQAVLRGSISGESGAMLPSDPDAESVAVRADSQSIRYRGPQKPDWTITPWIVLLAGAVARVMGWIGGEVFVITYAAAVWLFRFREFPADLSFLHGFHYGRTHSAEVSDSLAEDREERASRVLVLGTTNQVVAVQAALRSGGEDRSLSFLSQSPRPASPFFRSMLMDSLELKVPVALAIGAACLLFVRWTPAEAVAAWLAAVSGLRVLKLLARRLEVRRSPARVTIADHRVTVRGVRANDSGESEALEFDLRSSKLGVNLCERWAVVWLPQDPARRAVFFWSSDARDAGVPVALLRAAGTGGGSGDSLTEVPA